MVAYLREEIARKTADGTLTFDDIASLDFTTPAEVAVILRCDARTVRKRIGDGTWPALKVGDAWRIPTRWLRGLTHADESARRAGSAA